MSKESKSSYKAVIFDLDGTLIEFKFKVKDSRLAIIELLRKKGFTVSEFSVNTRTQALIDGAEQQLRNSKELSTKYSFDQVRNEVSQLLDEFEAQAFSEAKPHPGSFKVLKEISKKHILVAIVTNSGRAPVDAVLREHGFLPFLSVVVTRDESRKLKPEPDGLLQALEQLNVSPSDSLYVGDSIIDILAARSAGVRSVAVASGLYEAEALLKEEPDYLIHKIEDLEKIVFPEDV